MDLMPLAYVGPMEFALAWLLALGGMIFWIVMLVDVLRRSFSDSNTKLIWVVVIVLAQFPGALIYYFLGRAMAQRKP